MKNFIIKNLLNTNGKLNSRKIRESWFHKHGFSNEFFEISNFYPEFEQLADKILILLHGETYCQVCGKQTIAKQYCSRDCANKSSARAKNISVCLKQPGVMDKRKITMQERYGVDSNFHRPDIQAKITNRNHSSEIIESFVNKYGVSNPSQLNWVQDKKIENYRAIHGVSHHTHLENKYLYRIINSNEWWSKFSGFVEVQSLNLPISLSTLYLYAHRFRPDWVFESTISAPHQRIIDLLTMCQIEFITNTRSVIAPLELDIFIPTLNLAIEIDGVYWHSEISGKKHKTYHIEKTNRCKEVGVRLIHFFDTEIINKWTIVESIIKSAIGQTDRIYARYTECRVVDTKTERLFLDQNHIQGYVHSSECYGLFYHDELVSLMSFGKPRFDKSFDTELLRYTSKINTTVVGGASKLLAKCKMKRIVSYSDARLFSGAMYQSIGFDYIGTSSPSYFYTRNYSTLESRFKFQKHKLHKILDIFDSELSEWENMQVNGYDRVWDCGTIKWAKLNLG